MSTDLQDLLREGLDRLTAGATVPDGLVGRAQQHNRQRRIRIRAAIAACTAMAAVAAAVTVSLAASGNQPSNAPVRTQTWPTWPPAPSRRWPPRSIRARPFR